MTSLNPRQQEAVLAISGPVLVLAGAGSGKTSVITRKIAYLIQECGLPAHRIAAVTFTNKAAREMKERAGRLVSGPEARGLTVSTFHTLGLNLIKRTPERFDLKKNFSILDADDARTLLGELLHQEQASDRLDWVRQRISAFKNDLLSPAEALSRVADEDDAFAARVFETYERHLRAYNAVDFDDLIGRPTRALREQADLREQWQHRLHYLLIDEYQDTNLAQYELVRLLTGSRACFTAVGDDDQSIYAWRGARPENMAQLAVDYPQLQVIKLEQNYRSTGHILKAANTVIGHNPHVFEKQLWSAHGPGSSIRVIPCVHEEAEAEKVAADLLNDKVLHRRAFRDYAILYRGNFQSRVLETQLREFQIPYKISGGQSFFARAEIKDVMAYLRLIINPDDDNAFLRIINTPKREIGPVTLEKLGSYAQQRGTSLLAACDELGLSLHVGERAHQRLQDFQRWLQDRARDLMETDTPVASMRQMLTDVSYHDYLLDQSPTPTAAERRMASVESFLGSVQRLWDKADDEEARDIAAVIRKLVLLDLLEQQAEEDDSDRVQLMTLHAAKGLEFPHVYLVGLEEELLPHRNSIEAGTIEEERRLMYVGITRAMRALTLTYAQRRKQGGELLPTTHSRFLDELPEDVLEWQGKSAPRPEAERQAVARAHLSNLRDLLSGG